MPSPAPTSADSAPRPIQEPVIGALASTSPLPFRTTAIRLEPRFRPFSVEELPAESDLPFLIKGMLPANALTEVHGSPGAGKSFVALDMGLSIATGLPFFGCEAGFETNRPLFSAHGCNFRMESHPVRHAVREFSEGAEHAQEANMIRNFGSLVLSGKLDPTWGEIALKTQIVLDACLQSARHNGAVVEVK